MLIFQVEIQFVDNRNDESAEELLQHYTGLRLLYKIQLPSVSLTPQLKQFQM